MRERMKKFFMAGIFYYMNFYIIRNIRKNYFVS